MTEAVEVPEGLAAMLPGLVLAAVLAGIDPATGRQQDDVGDALVVHLGAVGAARRRWRRPRRVMATRPNRATAVTTVVGILCSLDRVCRDSAVTPR